MKMPVCVDLLEMIHEHFDKVLNPPVEAKEVDVGFHQQNLGWNALITIHFFKCKTLS